MIRSNFQLFRLWGIPVELNLSWLLVLALMTWSFATAWYADLLPDGTKPELWTLGFLTAIMLFVSILLHEFSHSLVASRNGLPIRKITLFLFGGVAQMDRDVDNPILELKMAAAGPAMTVVLAAVFFALSRCFAGHRLVYPFMQSLSRINLVVLVFNLVPGFPLDGGRILRAAIWKKTGNVQKATRIASRVGTTFAIVLMIYGVFNFFVGQLIGGVWLIFIGYFLRQAAQSGYLLVTLKQTLGSLRVSDVMRAPVITVDASTNLRHLVDEYFLRYHYSSFPVLENGALAGMVSLKDVKQIEMRHWQDATVGSIADRAVARYALRPEYPAETLLNLIMRKGYGRLPVIDGEGRVVGIVSRRDLMETIKMMAYLEE
ncbi:MAG TPA: site-2 protease family protein [Candidatus Bathyarchaeia archaeon]|nr:site-2 protease family protein [Candidatus Bathyarchaeia archaeon]